MLNRLYGTTALFLCAFLLIGCDIEKQENNAHTLEAKIPPPQLEVVNPNFFSAITPSNSNTVILIGSDSAVKYSENGIDWRNANTGAANFALFDIAENPKQGTLIAVGENGGILRSANKGVSWTTVNSGINDTIKHCTYSGFAKIWIAGGGEGTALTSVDDGKTWLRLNTLSTHILTGIVSIEHHKEWLVGTETGLLTSVNNGESWAEVPAANGTSITHIRTENNGRKVFALTSNGKLIVRENQEWKAIKVSSSGSYLTAISTNPNNDIVVTTSDGWAYTSTNSGNTWLGRKLADTYISEVVWQALARKFVLVGSEGLAYFSNSQGLDWQKQDLRQTNDYESLLAIPTTKNVITFGRGGQLAHWSLANNTVQEIKENLDGFIHSMVWLPNGRLISSGAEGWLKISDDGGHHWKAVSANVNATDYLFFTKYIADSNTLLAAGPPGVVFRSTDSGENWEKVLQADSAIDGNFQKLILDEKRAHVVALSSPGRLRYSADAGKTWAVADADTSNHLYNGAVNSLTGTFIAVGQNGVVQRSENGLNWQPQQLNPTTNLQGLAFHEGTNSWFAGGDFGALWRSQDDGKSWQALQQSTDKNIYNIFSVSNDTLLATGSRGLILRSSDGGNTWAEALSGVTENLREPLVMGDSSIIVSGRNGSLLKSRDNGVSWKKLPSNTAESLRTLALSPDKQKFIAAGRRIVLQP